MRVNTPETRSGMVWSAEPKWSWKARLNRIFYSRYLCEWSRCARSTSKKFTPHMEKWTRHPASQQTNKQTDKKWVSQERSSQTIEWNLSWVAGWPRKELRICENGPWDEEDLRFWFLVHRSDLTLWQTPFLLAFRRSFTERGWKGFAKLESHPLKGSSFAQIDEEHGNRIVVAQSRLYHQQSTRELESIVAGEGGGGGDEKSGLTR